MTWTELRRCRAEGSRQRAATMGDASRRQRKSSDGHRPERPRVAAAMERGGLLRLRWSTRRASARRDGRDRTRDGEDRRGQAGERSRAESARIRSAHRGAGEERHRSGCGTSRIERAKGWTGRPVEALRRHSTEHPPRWGRRVGEARKGIDGAGVETDGEALAKNRAARALSRAGPLRDGEDGVNSGANRQGVARRRTGYERTLGAAPRTGYSSSSSSGARVGGAFARLTRAFAFSRQRSRCLSATRSFRPM